MKIAFIRATGVFDDSRATKEIMTLADAGHTIEVLSWDRYGNAEEKNEEIFQKYCNVKFHYFHKLIPNGIGMKNIYKLFSWIKWVDKELKMISDLDAVHSCNLDTGLSAYKYCRKNNVKLVYDIYDYYVDSHNIPSILKDFVEKKEIRTINLADATIICTEERIEQIRKANPKKVIVIYNSPDVQVNYDNEISYDYVYCGALSSMRLINEILNEYPKHSELKFFFAGYGEYAEKCKMLAEKYENFEYSEPIPYSKVLEIESKSKCLSAIYKPTIRNHRLCAPNKFYEALALGKPLIVCRGTGIDKIVEENKLGKVINYNAKEFYQALLDLLSSPSDIIDMGERARLLYEQKYRWSLMKQRLITQYTDMINYR